MYRQCLFRLIQSTGGFSIPGFSGASFSSFALFFLPFLFFFFFVDEVVSGVTVVPPSSSAPWGDAEREEKDWDGVRDTGGVYNGLGGSPGSVDCSVVEAAMVK